MAAHRRGAALAMIVGRIVFYAVWLDHLSRDTFRLYASGSVTAWKVVCSLDPAS